MTADRNIPPTQHLFYFFFAEKPKYIPCFYNSFNIDSEICRDACVSQRRCCEMWQTDIVSDLYIAEWKDLNSCKQHCNQCPICSHVPLVWMPFCHFFHPLPSGCLRTSNPEKRAHLPKEETRFLSVFADRETWFVAAFNRWVIMCRNKQQSISVC